MSNHDYSNQNKKTSPCLKSCLIMLAILAVLIILIVNLFIFRGKEIGNFFLNRFDARITGELVDVPVQEGFEKAFNPMLFIGLKDGVDIIAFEGQESEDMIRPTDFYRDYFIKQGWMAPDLDLEDEEGVKIEMEEFNFQYDGQSIVLEKDDEYIILIEWSDEGKTTINIIKGPKSIVDEHMQP